MYKTVPIAVFLLVRDIPYADKITYFIDYSQEKEVKENRLVVFFLPEP